MADVAPVVLHHPAELLLLSLDFRVVVSVVTVADVESAEGIVLCFLRDLASCQAEIVAAVVVFAASMASIYEVEGFGAEDVVVDLVADLSWYV